MPPGAMRVLVSSQAPFRCPPIVNNREKTMERPRQGQFCGASRDAAAEITMEYQWNNNKTAAWGARARPVKHF
jgi:hypothetical protein